MSNLWSEFVQKSGTLYTSRRVRFDDYFRERFTQVFEIPDGARILEIGCGPGALCSSLSRWYPNSAVTGLDFDESFIKFARAHDKSCEFIVGDATALPFGGNSFDVTISNTVSEHIEPEKFYGEQYRVLKNGGICLMLSSRRGVKISSDIVSAETELEKEIWDRVDERFRTLRNGISIGEYAKNEQEHPIAMEKAGFRDVRTDYITLSLTPDDNRYPPELSRRMIESDRQCALDAVSFIEEKASDLVSAEETAEMKNSINSRFDRRLDMLSRGVKLWDTEIAHIMSVRGIK